MAARQKVFLYTGLILVNSVILTQIGGNFNSWGTLSPYIYSYFHSIDPSNDPSSLLWVAIFAFIAENLSFLLVCHLSLLYPPIYFIFSGILIATPMVYFSSYLQNSFIFCIVFGSAMGFLGTTTNIPSVWIAWNVVPKNRATSAGIALCAYSMAPVIYGSMFTILANPFEMQAVGDPSSGSSYFTQEIVNRVPFTIRVFALVMLGCGLISCLLLHTCNLKIKIEKNESSMTTLEMLNKKQTWFLIAMNYFVCLNGFYVINSYKDIAMSYFHDDYYLASVGAACFLIGSCGRLMFGKLLDIFEWKKVMYFALSLQLVSMFLLHWSFMLGKLAFSVCLVCSMFGIMGMFIGMLMICEKVFPKDRWVFSYISLSMIFDIFSVYIIRRYLTPSIGELWCNIIIVVSLAISLVLVRLHKYTREDYRELKDLSTTI